MHCRLMHIRHKGNKMHFIVDPMHRGTRHILFTKLHAFRRGICPTRSRTADMHAKLELYKLVILSV